MEKKKKQVGFIFSCLTINECNCSQRVESESTEEGLFTADQLNTVTDTTGNCVSINKIYVTVFTIITVRKYS